ncbi:hypothetical protein H6503_01200 [Candidatus Woesearchaeota archaeon]|nr:hypothetical protein [Candidatus Woesearchaeota archaeon]
MSEQKIVSFLKENGPSTPAKLAKHLGISQLFASAMLGEVASKGAVKISSLKIGGGSPLYYLKEDAEKLQIFANNLNSKDKQAFELLRNEKVLRDIKQTPIVRISLRTIKDFAIPLTIIRDKQKETFWKWYMLDDKDAEGVIREIFEKEEGRLQSADVEKTDQAKAATPTLDKKKETLTSIDSHIVEPIEKQKKKIEDKPVPKKVNEPKLTDFNTYNAEEMITEFQRTCQTSFGKKIIAYYSEKGIKILKFEQIKKNKEFSFILNVPSSVGNSKFYCKAVDKKKINETDLALVVVEGQHRQLPPLFLTTGEMSKKAIEQREALFKDLNIIKL